MFDFDFWYTGGLVVLMTFTLIKEIFEAEIVIFSTLILLVVGGVISTDEAFFRIFQSWNAHCWISVRRRRCASKNGAS